MSNRLPVALALLLASGLALGGKYPVALSFERWTSPQGELIKLDPQGRSSRDYRITALTRTDPNRPGFALQPLDLFGDRVRTFDRRVTLHSRVEKRVWIYYDPVNVAYLRIDHRLQNAHSYVDLDGQPIIRSGEGIPFWGVLLTFGMPILAAIMVEAIGAVIGYDPLAGALTRTVPIPLDGQVHILKIGAGPNICVAFGGWDAYYKLDTSRMKPGKIYWLFTHHWCDIGVHGYVILKTNSITVDYKRNGMPPLVEPGQLGWLDASDGIPLKVVQWTTGWHSTLEGQPVSELFDPITGGLTYYLERGGAPIAHFQRGDEPAMRGPVTFQDIRLKPTNRLTDAPVIPGEAAHLTVSTRHSLKGGGKAQQWYYFSGRRNRVNIWSQRHGIATYEVVRQASPLHLYLDPALDGTITKEESETENQRGEKVKITTYRAYPQPKLLSFVTVEETFRCISGPCPSP